MTILIIDEIDTYYENSHLLHGASLEIDEGELVTLPGRNGAEKTTIIRSIIGASPPRSDSIAYCGEEITGLSSDEINGIGISLVPEGRRVFPTLTVEKNLRLAHNLASDPRPVEEMYELFPGLDDLRDSNGRNLSGDEQQMVSVACALVQSPEVLLLDEPTEGLAPVIVDDLKEIVQTVVEQNVTVLLTEQNVDFAFELAERGYMMDTGEIVFDGTVEETRDRNDLFETYLSVGTADA